MKRVVRIAAATALPIAGLIGLAISDSLAPLWVSVNYGLGMQRLAGEAARRLAPSISAPAGQAPPAGQPERQAERHSQRQQAPTTS